MLTQDREFEIEGLLLKAVPGLAEQWRGATSDEIAQIEQIAGRPLPSFYRWFLTRMGQGMGPLAYPTLDFSARRVLACYAARRVERHPRFLLIGHESREMMPHTFYDLDAPRREDALVVDGFVPGGEFYDGFETFREMLAFRALWIYRIDKMPQQCEGGLVSHQPDIFSLLGPVMSGLGFTKPIPTGPLCGLYERPDAAMACKCTPGNDPGRDMRFYLGGSSAGTLRRILGVVASESSLEVEVDEWTPALP